MKILAKLTTLLIIASLLCPRAGFCLAPPSPLPAASRPATTNRYQLLIERYLRNNPKFSDIPQDKFASFLQYAETLFKDYLTYSRFPYNTHAAFQFAESKRALIHEIRRLYIQSLGHLPKKESLSRRQGIARLEELTATRLQQDDFSVINLMGRPGVGKTTIANKIKNGFASLAANQILVISVDGFKNNDVTLVNKLIAKRELLNIPLQDLADEQYAFFEQVSQSLRFPLVRDSGKSFLDFYLVAEEDEQETGENIRGLRRRKLWNRVGSVPGLQRLLERPLRLLTPPEYTEIERLSRDMRLNLSQIEKNSGLSFLDLYEALDRKEFLAAVREKKRHEGEIKLFIVEGTYSYQGEKIFSPATERLLQGNENRLLRVMIELEEPIRQERIRDRGRSDVDEMLILQPVFDAIFSASLDLERNPADIIIDNTETTDIFQTRETPSGVKAQFGIVTETARTTLTREMQEGETPPDIFFLPTELFRGGTSYADLEFLIYYNYFFRGQKKVSVVGTEGQKRRIMEFMRQSLFGPDLDKLEEISPELKSFLKYSYEHFAVRDQASGTILPLEAYIDFHIVNIGEQTEIEVQKEDKTINVTVGHIQADLFSIQEEGGEQETVEVDYREQPVTNHHLSAEQQRSLQNAALNTMAVTPMGSEDGFTPQGDYTNFIIWLNGKGIHVDPSPRSLIYLERAGIDPDDIPYVLLTHNHADHDSGLIRRMLLKKRIKLLTTRPIYESFVSKAHALLGEDFCVSDWVDWVELDDQETNEIELPGGDKACLDIRYNFHSIPTIGFVLSYQDKRFGYSGDTLYDPELIRDLAAQGKISAEQAEKLLYFFWDEKGEPTVDLLFHEAGVAPLHTLLDTLCELPEKIYDRLRLVHIDPARRQEETRRQFQQPELFATNVLIPADSKRKKQILRKTLEDVYLLTHLDTETKIKILEKGIVRTFNPGDPVIFEGDRADTFYIILSGRAEVVKGGERVTDARGRQWLLGEKPVWTFYPKDSFGEVALVDDSPRTATVRAASGLTVLEIHKDDFLNLIYAPLKDEDSPQLRQIKYCLEEWIQRYSEGLIDSISDFHLTQIARQLQIRQYSPGERIIKQGDEADKAYIILDGKIGIYKNQERLPVTDREHGDIIGEMALLEMIRSGGEPVLRNADCVAENDVQVLQIDRELFEQILHIYPGLDRGLRYEYRLRLLAHGAEYPAPHKYMVSRPQRVPQRISEVEREEILEEVEASTESLNQLTDLEKILYFLNNIFTDSEFSSPEIFSGEFYHPEDYREKLILLTKRLSAVFPAFQIQRFYHKFIEVSVYDPGTSTKTIYRLARNRQRNKYRWAKESEVAVITGLTNSPVNSLLINLESERYRGVKGTPENTKALQAYLEMYNENCNLNVIDCQWPENSVDFIIERIKSEKPEMICVSSTFGCLPELERLLQAVRKLPLPPLVVVGGLTATWSHEYLLENYPDIICVRWEGEEALSQLVDLVYEQGLLDGKIPAEELLAAIPNLVYLSAGKIRKNEVKKVDLRRAPHPSRRTQLERMKYAGFLLNSEGSRRGCEYGKCTFCTRTHGQARPLRLTRVTGDFEEYLRSGASFIVYADEDFIPNDPAGLDDFIDRLEQIKETYRNEYFLEYGMEPEGISFYIATRARCIWREGDEDGNEVRVRMLERLKKIGLVKIFLGVESGSPVQLKKTYNKEANLTEIEQAINIIRALGLQVVAGYIPFDPVVTLGQLQENCQFAHAQNLVRVDALTEPINPFKQFRAQAGSVLAGRLRALGLIASDHNPNTLMYDLVFRSQPIRMIMDIGGEWDNMISLLEYSLKGVIWHAEQSPEEMERAELFIELFNWLREEGYCLLEELCAALVPEAQDCRAKIDIYFDQLSGLGRDKILFEVKRSLFPHLDIYKEIEKYITDNRLEENETIEFLKSFFNGDYPEEWNFNGTPLEVYRNWTNDMAQSLSFQVMTTAEMAAARNKLQGIFKRALAKRLRKLKHFQDTRWESYYSLSPDSLKRGIEFNRLLEDTIREHEETTVVPEAKPAAFRVYHRVSLKHYFRYRHPDLAEPLAVLIKLADFLKEHRQTADLDKIFLYPDGTLKCDKLTPAGNREMNALLYQGLRQLYLSAYDPATERNAHDFQLTLHRFTQTKSIDIAAFRQDLSRLYRVYARASRKESVFYSRETIDGSCQVEIFADGQPILNELFTINGKNIPTTLIWELPASAYRAGENNRPVVTAALLKHTYELANRLLRTNDIEDHKQNIMIINALAGILEKLDSEQAAEWLEPLAALLDEAVLPLTVYLPDTDASRQLAASAPLVPVIYVHPLIYARAWPGIEAHLEDILLLATPGILDDFSRMLSMVRAGKLRPEIARLIYELFHNRVNPKAFMRNENFAEVIKYTSNEMRVMPRRTPVLLYSPDNPQVTQFCATEPHEFMFTPEGKIRFLLHPYTYKKWLEQGVTFPRRGTEMEWTLTYPTASHRTLFVLGADREQHLIAKVHSTIWVGPAMRRLKPNSVDHSFRVSERLRQPLDLDEVPAAVSKFAYLVEQGFTLYDPELYPEGIGVLYRSVTPYPAAAEDRVLMPLYAAHNNAINVADNPAETPLVQLINWNKETAEDPVDCFIRIILIPLYEIYFYYMFEQGFLLEPHGQNFYKELDINGKVLRLAFKDWQSTMVNMQLRERLGLSGAESIVKHLLGVEAAEATSLSIVFDHYWGNYLMKQLLEVLVDNYHEEREKTVFRQELLKRFKDTFAEYFRAYPQCQPEFPDVTLRHGKKPPTDLTNTVYFAAGGAPLFRATAYERQITALRDKPAEQKGKIVVPVSRAIDPNAKIQRQEDLPTEMTIDFERLRHYSWNGQTWQDIRDFPTKTPPREKNFLVIYPENYDPAKKYNLLVAIHGKGSHPARLLDVPEKMGTGNEIIIIPRAPFRFSVGYTWFNEDSDQVDEMKQESADFIAGIIDFFQNAGLATDKVQLAGISEGGHLAQAIAMKYPEKISGIIAINAPFYEKYFTAEDLARVGADNYPDIFLLQYTGDRIVRRANTQRAAAFYESRGLQPRQQYYNRGSHHRINMEMGEDIREWLSGLPGDTDTATETPLPLKNALAVARMAQQAIPLLLILLPQTDTEKSRQLHERFDLINSALCYCLFQAELLLKDPATKTDPFFMETITWLERETKSLLKELMELSQQAQGEGRIEIAEEPTATATSI